MSNVVRISLEDFTYVSDVVNERVNLRFFCMFSCSSSNQPAHCHVHLHFSFINKM